MNTQDFCYWLQGYFELSGTDGGLSKEQVEVIKEHLQLVFKKETVKTVNETVKSVEEVPVKSPVKELVDKYMREQRYTAPTPVFPTPLHLDPSKWKSPYEVTCSSEVKQLPDGLGVKFY